jgi:signal transduction histidine kinase
MDDMTQKLLGLATLSRSEITREQVDLSITAQEILDVHRINEPDRQVHIQIQRGLVVQADRVLITQVLMNLLGNAWKFTRDTEDARIEVGATSGPGGQRVLFVRDNGPGFDMKEAKRMFAPFVRLHTDQRFEGTGVGLATVHKIIARHGGAVWADAAVGGGACFYFTVSAQERAPKARRARKSR